MRRHALAWAGACAAVSAPAGAAPLIFSGVITAELGYGTNPFLVEGTSKGEGYGAISFQPSLTHSGPRSSTSLSGVYYRQQYFSGYGHSDTLSATLSHTRELTEHLNFNLAASFSDTDNAILSPGFDPSIVDAFTTGQRSRLFAITGGLSWQATARDSFSVSGSYSHSDYGRQRFLIASDYNNYGGTFSYLHAVSARTKVGVQVSASELHSADYPHSSSVSPALTLQQILSPIWVFNGNVGLIHQHYDGPYGRSSNAVGFSGQLCGTYPRRSICASVVRQSAASGFGGLRTDLTTTVTLTDKLTEHSTLSFTGTYDDSSGQGFSGVVPGTLIDVPDQRIFQARADYSRQLGRRLSAGATLRAQWRDYSGFGSARAFGGSVNLSYRVGRI